MAVRLSNQTGHEQSKNSSVCVHEKRITPFSIDDILAKTKDHTDKLNSEKKSNVSKNDSLPSYSNFYCNISNDNHCWNQEAYAKWIEGFQRLCAATALQPFWFNEYRTQPKHIGCHQSCSHPYAEDKLHLHPPKKLDVCDLDSCLKGISKRQNKVILRERKNTIIELKTNDRQQKQETSANENDSITFSGGSGSEDGPFTQSLSKTNKNTTGSDSPLSALEKLACVTFKGMEEKPHELHAVAVGRESKAKRRKCRTAFTALQLSVLERRFTCHKYLTPTDRDQIAHILGLSAPQVITWFQNRRAKLKRDLEEMRNDLKTVKKWTHKDHKILSPPSPRAKLTCDERMEADNE